MTNTTQTTERNAKTMTAQEIAKAIREALKAAVKSGELPKAAYFVRQTWAGYTPKITVTVKGWKGQVHNEGWLEHIGLYNEWPRHLEMLSGGAKSLLKTAEKIAAQFNYDESRIEYDHFDRGYYLHVDFADRAAIREAEMTAFGLRGVAA